jgi:hypothetical protein
MMAHQMEAQHPEVGGPGVGEQQLVPALVELLAPLEPREKMPQVHLGACRGRRDGHEEAAQPLEVVLVHLLVVGDDSLELGQPLAELGRAHWVHQGHLLKRVDPVVRGDVEGAGRHGGGFQARPGNANVISLFSAARNACIHAFPMYTRVPPKKYACIHTFPMYTRVPRKKYACIHTFPMYTRVPHNKYACIHTFPMYTRVPSKVHAHTRVL